MGAQRISYVPVEQMDSEMHAEMERCRREGTTQFTVPPTAGRLLVFC